MRKWGLLNSYGRNRVGIGRFSPKSQGRKRLGEHLWISMRLEEFWKTYEKEEVALKEAHGRIIFPSIFSRWETVLNQNKYRFQVWEEKGEKMVFKVEQELKKYRVDIFGLYCSWEVWTWNRTLPQPVFSAFTVWNLSEFHTFMQGVGYLEGVNSYLFCQVCPWCWG